MRPTFTIGILLLSMVGFVTSHSASASPVADSLWQQYQQAIQHQDPKTQVLLLCQLGRWISGSQRLTDIDSGIALATKALKIAESTQDSSIITTAVIYLSGLYDSRNETGQSLRHLRRALQAALLTENEAQLSLCYSFISKAFFRGGNFTEAFSFASKGYALAERSNDQTAKVFAAYELSRCYWAKSDFQTAEQYDSIAFSVAAGNVLLYNPANHLRSEGVNAFAQRKYEKAIDLWQKGIVANQQIGEPLRARFLYVNISFAYRELKKYDLEDSNMVRGIELHHAAQDTLAELDNLRLLAFHREKYGRSNDADSIMRAIVQLAHASHNHKLFQAHVWYWQGQHSVGRGNLWQGYRQFQQARLLLDTAATDDIRLLLLKHVLSALVASSESLGQWRDAAKWLKELASAQQRHRFQEDKSALEQINDFYTLQHEQANFDLLKLERESAVIKNTASIIIIGLLTAVAVLMIIIAYRRRRNAQELQALVEELEKNKTVLELRNQQYARFIAERQEFMAIAAHDIKTPIIGIRMSANWLHKENGALSATAHNRLHQIESASNRILIVLNNLMDYATTTIPIEKITTPLTEYDIIPYTEMIANDFEEEAIKRSLTLEVNASLDSPITLKKTIPYHEIMENLLSNAVKYAPFGAKITVSIRQNGKGCEVEVHDPGATIATKDCERIFNKGVRLHPSDNGSHGIGLFAARRTAESQGWKLHCRVGSGTSFILSMPRNII